MQTRIYIDIILDKIPRSQQSCTYSIIFEANLETIASGDINMPKLISKSEYMYFKYSSETYVY